MSQKVNAIANGYEILKSLSNQNADQGVTEIAKVTGISPSSCFNILRTLVDLGLADFDENTKGYSLGLGIFELARNGLSHNPILVAAQPSLITLAQRHNATLGLWDIDGDNESELIAMGENSSPARLHLRIGSRQPIAAGSSGRAALSMYPENIPWMKSRFAEVEWQGSINFNEYLADIKAAREAGYAVDRDKFYLGISTVSAGFDEPKTGRKYCLTAVLLSGAHDADSIIAVGCDLKSTAVKLSNIDYKT